MKAIIYVRVSTREQAEEGLSLTTQENACRDYAKKKGFDVAKVFVEEGESAKTTERTRLKEMLQYCADHRKEVDALVVFKINRLARNTQDYLALKSAITGFGISIHYVTENYEDNPVGRLMETVVASIAQFDNEQRAEVSKNGMIDAVQLEGRWCWKAPIGYENTRVDGKKNIAPRSDPEQLRLLRRYWELIDAGLRPEGASRLVTKEGLRGNTGKVISKSAFNKMLENTLYKGVIRAFGLTVVSKSIKPVIEPELFDRVLLKLKGKDKPLRKYSKANPLFPLRNILRCPNGHNMTGSAPRGNGGVYYKYHCSHCRGKGTSHSKQVVEQKFRELLDGYEYQPELKDALVEAIATNWEFRMLSNRKEVRRLEKEILELKARDKLIVNKNLTSVYSDEKTKELLADNNLDIAKRQMELNDIKELDEDVSDIVEFGFSSLQRSGSIWEEMEDVEIKQKFQKWFFPAGIEYDGQQFGTAILPLCISIKKDLSEEKSLLVNYRNLNWNQLLSELKDLKSILQPAI